MSITIPPTKRTTCAEVSAATVCCAGVGTECLRKMWISIGLRGFVICKSKERKGKDHEMKTNTHIRSCILMLRSSSSTLLQFLNTCNRQPSALAYPALISICSQILIYLHLEISVGEFPLLTSLLTWPKSPSLYPLPGSSKDETRNDLPLLKTHHTIRKRQNIILRRRRKSRLHKFPQHRSAARKRYQSICSGGVDIRAWFWGIMFIVEH